MDWATCTGDFAACVYSIIPQDQMWTIGAAFIILMLVVYALKELTAQAPR